jgi:lysine-ketoglutarate reductase/saccharopine dehydrogenase-like protein (TIGR00300 family)
MTQGLPDFALTPFAGAPPARFEPAPADGVLPEGFFSTSNLPTYVNLDGSWVMPANPRMDGALVRRDGGVVTLEPRAVRKGDLVAVGLAEDGGAGIVVHTEGFLGGRAGPNEFRFMSADVSRERPVNYEELASRVEYERRNDGYLVWVVGPALVHARAREDLVWFIGQGYVHAMLIGNAVAVHDVEAAIYGTTLGVTEAGAAAQGGHGLHMRAINRIAALGSIERAVAEGVVQSGIMHALVRHRIPYVLAGSIRDDGPLPGVLTDTVLAQDAMRRHTTRATGAIFVATALHSIAVGNMLPAFHLHRGRLEPLMTVCVDQTEFVVTKLRDRGTHQAYGVVTNAQDFMHVFRHYVDRCRRS